MPNVITVREGATSYASPFVGPVDHPAHVKIDISGLTDDEVDANGYLKPGVPLNEDGTLIGTGEFVFGVVIEATKLPLATLPATTSSLGSETGDCFVAVGTIGQVNRDIVEDNLGRALTAFEIAGFTLAGCHITLLPT